MSKTWRRKKVQHYGFSVISVQDESANSDKRISPNSNQNLGKKGSKANRLELKKLP